MPVEVIANGRKNTHHVSLTDKEGNRLGLIAVNSRGEADILALNRTPVDRTAMKTTSGNQKYSDFNPPYAPIVQDDWSGGRGNADFERDVTRYLDGYRIITRRSNRAFLGPQETYGTGYRSSNSEIPGSVNWQALIGTQRYIARKFDVSTGYTAGEEWILIARRGTPKGPCTVVLKNNNAGVPGTDIASATVTIADMPDVLSEWRIILNGGALSGSTSYWVDVIGDTNDDSSNHWRVACKPAASPATRISVNGSSWTTPTFDLYFRVVDNASNWAGYFYNYKGATYFVTRPISGAPKLYINGDRGTADSNSGQLTKTIDATKAWGSDQYKSAIVLITGGTGKTEAQPWREITANDTTSLTVSPAWTITQDTTTEYVILGSNYWTEITGHGITAPITGKPLVSGLGVIYFPQGDTVLVREMEEKTVTGAWTRNYRNQATAKATFMIEGATKIWKGNNDDLGTGLGNTSIANVTSAVYGTDYTFGTAIVCGSNLARITGLEVYVDDSNAEAVWVFKEDEVGFIKSSLFVSLQLKEMQTVKSEKNGLAHLVHNTYLYWSMMNGLEQYYRPTLDDIGVNLDEGLPSDRQGNYADLLGYPGRVFGVINAGTGYSSIMAYDNNGHHEEYRGPKGKPITATQFQVVPGARPDRLWFIQGGDLVFIPFPSETTNPLLDSQYTYTCEGALTLSWMTAGMGDTIKFAKLISAMCENLSVDHRYIEIDYKTDDDTTWTILEDKIEETPSDTIDLTEQFGIEGKRLLFRMRFITDDNTKTPVLLAFLVETVARIVTKYAYSVPYIAEDDGLDLMGNPDDYTDANKKIDIMASWSSKTMMKLNCGDPLYDNRLIFVIPQPARAVQVNEKGNKRIYMGTLVVQDA